MSKRQYLKSLQNEIEKLNGVIDLKIVLGRDYRREARRHRALMRELQRERTRHQLSFFTRFFSFSR